MKTSLILGVIVVMSLVAGCVTEEPPSACDAKVAPEVLEHPYVSDGVGIFNPETREGGGDTFSEHLRVWSLGKTESVYSQIKPRRGEFFDGVFTSTLSELARDPKTVPEDYRDMTLDELVESWCEQMRIEISDCVSFDRDGDPYLSEDAPRVDVYGRPALSSMGIHLSVDANEMGVNEGFDSEGYCRSKRVFVMVTFDITCDKEQWPVLQAFGYNLDVMTTIKANEGTPVE